MTAQCLNGDCLELMKCLPDKSVDLFICDLPYGCLKGGGNAYKKGGAAYASVGCAWDIKINLTVFWAEVERLCSTANTPVLMYCNTKFGNELINSNPSWFRYDIVWNKQSGTQFLHANTRPMSSHEMIYVFSKKAAFYNRINVESRCPLSVINFPLKRDKRHPTAKPVELLKWLIERYSNEGDTVLDPTAGSFNSGRAAVELGRNYIGVEMDKDFFEKNKL